MDFVNHTLADGDAIDPSMSTNTALFVRTLVSDRVQILYPEGQYLWVQYKIFIGLDWLIYLFETKSRLHSPLLH